MKVIDGGFGKPTEEKAPITLQEVLEDMVSKGAMEDPEAPFVAIIHNDDGMYIASNTGSVPEVYLMLSQASKITLEATTNE